MPKLWATAPVVASSAERVPPPIDHTRPPATMGEPLAAEFDDVHEAVGADDDTVTAWMPLLQGTNRVPSRSAEPPSAKQKLEVSATCPPIPPRWDWLRT